MVGVAGREGTTSSRPGATARVQASWAPPSDLHVLAESLPIGIYRTTPDGRILYANAALLSMLGYTSFEELAALDLEGGNYPPSYDRRGFRERIDLERVVRGLESVWRRKDGSSMHVRENVQVVQGAAGGPVYYEGTVEDVTERRRAQELLREQKELSDAVLRTLSDANEGLTIIDPQMQRVVYVNDALCRMSGYTERELLTAESLWADVSPEQAATLKDGFERRMRGESALERYELEVRRKDGTPIVIEVNVKLFHNGGQARFLAMVRDVTERRRQEGEVRLMNQRLEARVHERTAELEAANKELEAFSYSASHDLRAPLRTVEGFGQALDEDHASQLDPEGRHLLQRIRSAAHRMSRLIDDMLNLSRVTRAELRQENVDLSHYARAVASQLRAQDLERDVHFVIRDGIGAYGDPSLLRLVLENLVGNAWKFTSKKEKARIEFGRREVDGEPVYFVSDDGAGFDMAHQGKLFVPFQRLHRLTEFEGSGIGLATVQRIVQRHGGRAWAEGVPDKGATFFFTLSAKGGPA